MDKTPFCILILNQANGLSNNKVNCILQDKRGFTWIGTDDGLNRYDGNNFLVFKNIPGQSSTISGNTITDLYEDKEAVLWIATADGGITRYDDRLKPDEQFHQFKHQPGNVNSIPVNIVNAIKEDNDGYLWLATGGAAVLRFDKRKEQFVKPGGIGKWTIYDICFDKGGMLWAGREGGSILKVDPKTLKAYTDQRYSNVYAALPHVVVTRLFTSQQQFIQEFLPSFNQALDEPLRIYDFLKDEHERLWIGTNKGLYIKEPDGTYHH